MRSEGAGGEETHLTGNAGRRLNREKGVCIVKTVSEGFRRRREEGAWGGWVSG
jgi:hypothetical protein